MPESPLPDLSDLPRAELRAFLAGLGEPAFRGDQVFRWIWKRGARSFEAMTDLPEALRRRLAGAARLGGLAVQRRLVSRDGTRKLLLGLDDGRQIECVLIPEGRRMTLCVSSQVGCALACAFCATGTMGLTRNLRPGEIAGQVLLAHRDLAAEPHPLHPARERPVTSLVYMGMGEPLHNFENVLRSLEILADAQGLAYPERRVTVSTVGLVPQMLELGRRTGVNLAVSLHAPDEGVRGSIMPINRRYPLAEVVDACRQFPLPARRRVTFEYVLLHGVNDRVEDAERLARLLAGLRAKVNLIPWNPYAGAAFERPAPEDVQAFSDRLRELGVACTVRTTRGLDIAAACGQLALSG